MFKEPKDLQEALVELFPSFIEEVDEEYDELYNPLTYHRVWMDFSPLAKDFLTNAGKKELKGVCLIINASVEHGEDQENAVSTCFLEHASQIRVDNLIKANLSSAARSELI